MGVNWSEEIVDVGRAGTGRQERVNQGQQPPQDTGYVNIIARRHPRDEIT